MVPTRRAVHAATNELVAREPRLAPLLRRAGTCPIGPPSPPSERFAHLVRAICFQQLAGKAAATIHARLVAQLGGTVTAATVLAAPEGSFRAAGVSANKTAAMRDLAAHVDDGRIRLDRIARRPDEAVIEELIQARGVGRWTAQMFLINHLGRLDVWPIGDLGVRMGHARIFGLADPLPASALEPEGERFRPYRSVLAWYCWRAVDLIPAHQ